MTRKYDDFEVQEICEDEGLDYAVRHYMGPESIKNPETARLWEEAGKALNALAEHLHLET